MKPGHVPTAPPSPTQTFIYDEEDGISKGPRRLRPASPSPIPLHLYPSPAEYYSSRNISKASITDHGNAADLNFDLFATSDINRYLVAERWQGSHENRIPYQSHDCQGVMLFPEAVGFDVISAAVSLEKHRGIAPPQLASSFGLQPVSISQKMPAGANDPPRYGTASKEKENQAPHQPSALTLGPRKKPSLSTDPLVHHGRHFGRTVYAFANVHALLVAGLAADEDSPPETQQERRELRVFRKLLALIPGFEEKLVSCQSEEQVIAIAGMIQKGAASARSDDTKSLKGAIIDWIGRSGFPVEPPLSRSMKQKRGFEHERTGFLLCPPDIDWNDVEIKRQLRSKELTITGSHWPIFLYKDEKYDSENPWRGLFRNEMLVKGYKHIFTSPSSVDDEPKATRSGNARIHGMSHVTPASLAYVCTQVRFALTSAAVFSRTDRETDSETFYNSIMELLEDPEEQDEVKPLVLWWNQRIFPSFSTSRRLAPSNSALSRIKERRRQMSARSQDGLAPPRNSIA
ncbi:hypothetical protein NMY22_g8043 [Coprinellus aureogranulatus]|nr:hypothetical protein NMY22_g8043 [Coprinellus aureogranulatus]